MASNFKLKIYLQWIHKIAGNFFPFGKNATDIKKYFLKKLVCLSMKRCLPLHCSEQAY